MSKKLLFSASILALLASPALATTAFTFADGSATVTTTATQTLTNKTIAYSSNTLTGVAPTASPTFTGTMTLPDSSTWTSSALSGVKVLGIGTTSPLSGQLLDIKPATNQHFTVTGNIDLASGVGVQSVNDAFNTFEPIELRASVVNIEQGGLTLGASTVASEGSGTINISGAYYSNGTKGVTCSGALTVVSSITITDGIITAATGTGGTCS